MLNNKYIIENVINSGSFGTIYKANYKQKLYAIKEQNEDLLLRHESKIYLELLNVKHISRLYDFFKFENKYYMVLDYYKYTLDKYKSTAYNSKNYLLNLQKIFKTLLLTIKDIHDRGIVHRDLKPNNICLNNNFEPYIIDFGLAKKIIHKKHVEFRNIKSIIGSYNFVSNNVIQLIEPVRRDDIISIIYIFMYMLLCDKIINNIYNIKYDLNKLENELYNLLAKNITFNIIEILKYCNKMTFTQEPNYIYIINKLFMIYK